MTIESYPAAAKYLHDEYGLDLIWETVRHHCRRGNLGYAKVGTAVLTTTDLIDQAFLGGAK